MSFIAELKRRNVFRVGAAYAIVGWLLVEVASVLLPTFEAPGWVMKAFASLVILGLPLALILAWAFELDGISPVFDEVQNPGLPDVGTSQLQSPNLRD